MGLCFVSGPGAADKNGPRAGSGQGSPQNSGRQGQGHLVSVRAEHSDRRPLEGFQPCPGPTVSRSVPRLALAGPVLRGPGRPRSSCGPLVRSLGLPVFCRPVPRAVARTADLRLPLSVPFLPLSTGAPLRGAPSRARDTSRHHVKVKFAKQISLRHSTRAWPHWPLELQVEGRSALRGTAHSAQRSAGQ